MHISSYSHNLIVCYPTKVKNEKESNKEIQLDLGQGHGDRQLFKILLLAVLSLAYLSLVLKGSAQRWSIMRYEADRLLHIAYM